MTRKPFEGVLAEPLPDIEEDRDKWRCAMTERMEALSDHYGYDWKSETVQLLMTLAMDTVPGFKTPAKKGAKPTAVKNDLDILAGVFALKSQGMSWEKAFKGVAKKRKERGEKTRITTGSVKTRVHQLKKGGPEMDRVWRIAKHFGNQKNK